MGICALPVIDLDDKSCVSSSRVAEYSCPWGIPAEIQPHPFSQARCMQHGGTPCVHLTQELRAVLTMRTVCVEKKNEWSVAVGFTHGSNGNPWACMFLRCPKRSPAPAFFNRRPSGMPPQFPKVLLLRWGCSFRLADPTSALETVRLQYPFICVT